MSPVELPEPVTRCLWDTDLGSVRWETHRAHLLMALTYFDDAERDTEPILQSRDDWAGVKETLRGRVRELAGR